MQRLRRSGWLTPLRGLADVARNANLRRLELGWASGMTAEWAYFVALGIFAYRTGGTFAVGLVGLVRMLPSAIVAPFASVVGDRYRRQRVLTALQLAKTLAVGASAVAFFVGPAGVVYALAAFVGIALTLYWPIQSALLPWLAEEPHEIVSANAASATIESLGTLVGPLVGGLVVAWTNPGVAFAVAAAAHLTGTVLLARIRVEGETARAAEIGGAELRELVVEPFETIAHEPAARLTTLLFWAQSLVRGALNVLIVVSALHLLHIGPSGVGYLTAAIGAGGLAGGVFAVGLVGRRVAVPFGFGLVFWGLPIAAIGLWPHAASAVVFLAILGAGNAVLDVSGVTLLQRVTPDEQLARVFGLMYGVAMGAVGVGSLLVSPLIAGLGTRAALVATGALLPLLALLSWRSLVAIDRKTTAPERELRLLRGVPMFAPLPLAAAELLARKLHPVSAQAGTDLVREGEPGDRFYVVASGELDVRHDGQALRTLHSGDFFGEIALLRDVPRTATVTVRDDALLYALDRDDFLRVVTGHAASEEAGKRVVTTRLQS
jgi:MFS family permease